ncbi:hypothetical protein PIROE2DRAFT_15215 [Piromyces sp. E2]|nr:hypothetical protein PIROE2DRAFT_15215 [Piromyces sp. E2]|eukprot:OUM59297.1 hypothetical protein PIROE2DRAFT_15215 [Piromyces sp. E2]
MEYNEFEKKLLSQLENDDVDCLNTIRKNEELIQTYLQNTENQVHIKSLVGQINNVILNKNSQFDNIEQVVKYDSMKDVLSEFRESDIVIRACEKENVGALKWLLTIDINPFVSNKDGVTSLMRAAEHKILFFVVEYLVKDNEDLVNIVDKNGENVLFHAINNPVTFEYLLKTKIDVNHLSHNKETVLHISCKKNISFNIEKLYEHPDIDYSIADKEGKTPYIHIMTLLHRNRVSSSMEKLLEFIDYTVVDETGVTPLMRILKLDNYELLIKILVRLSEKATKSSNLIKLDINYRNKSSNESLLSILIKKYYQMCCKRNYRQRVPGKRDLITSLAIIFGLIISYPGCDINIPIDEVGNTPLMFFLIIEDYVAANFILSYCKNVDLGIKNKNGISASVLALKIKKETVLLEQFLNHKTFDKQFIDPHHNNLLMYSVLFDNSTAFINFINDNPEALQQTNDKKENVVILAAKLGFLEKITNISIPDTCINQQDALGNTALFYAVQMKNMYDVNLLVLGHADPNLKNNQMVSPMDLAKQMEEKQLMDYLNEPIPILEMKKNLNDSIGGGFFNKIKSSDEKLDEGLKNYKLVNYTEEYKEILKKCNIYSLCKGRTFDVDEQLALSLYITLDCCECITMNHIDPKETLNRREILYCRKRNIKPTDKNQQTKVRYKLMFSSNETNGSFNINELLMYRMPTAFLCI